LFYKKAKFSIYILLFLTFILSIECIYLDLHQTPSTQSIEQKKSFVSLLGLPDLAISTEATFIRHRSVSSVFDVYKDDGVLREYFPSSFVIMGTNQSSTNE